MTHNFARPDILPAFSENNIAIALSTDENYIPYVNVLVRSIVANTKSGNIDLLILNDGLPADVQKSFIDRFSNIDNLSIRFLDVGSAVKNTGSTPILVEMRERFWCI